MSAEAHIPVVDITRTFDLPSMGGNVAANLVSLGAFVNGPTPEGPLPVKNRLYTQEGQQLARWDQNDHCSPLQGYQLAGSMFSPYVQIVLIADYGKGAITPEVITWIAEEVEQRDIPLFVDTKCNPMAYVEAGVNLNRTLFFPNQSEYSQFKREYELLPQVLLKRGAQGLSAVEYGEEKSNIPSFAQHVQCVNGAGDTILAAFTKAFVDFPSMDLYNCMAYASAAAAAVVEQPFDQRTP